MFPMSPELTHSLVGVDIRSVCVVSG